MTNALLIQAIVQQTMVFVAQLATFGRDRVPLAKLSDQVFLALIAELRNHGVRQKVIADMFGMALRTYHRRVKALNESTVAPGRTLWGMVLDYIEERQPINAAALHDRFSHDRPEILREVLNELVDAGCVYRAGTGRSAVYRIADQADFSGDKERQAIAQEYLVWLAVYRQGPLESDALCNQLGVTETECTAALESLIEKGAVKLGSDGYTSRQFVVEVGDSHGWEAALLDHYQAMVGAVVSKLTRGSAQSRASEVSGGTTYCFDLPENHPLEEKVLGLLGRIRGELDELRDAVDAAAVQAPKTKHDHVPRKVVFYAGQYVKE